MPRRNHSKKVRVQLEGEIRDAQRQQRRRKMAVDKSCRTPVKVQHNYSRWS